MEDYKRLSDNELVNLLKDSDHAAYNEIYERYWKAMYVYASKLLQDPIEAEDTVQEVLIYIWDKSERINISHSITSYLYSSVRHKALKIMLRKKTHEKYLSSFKDFLDRGEYLIEESIRERELRQVIDNAITGLPAKMRQIFEMSRNEQLSQKTIAEKLNLSDKTVKKQVGNAMKILRLKISQITLFLFL